MSHGGGGVVPGEGIRVARTLSLKMTPSHTPIILSRAPGPTTGRSRDSDTPDDNVRVLYCGLDHLVHFLLKGQKGQ